MADLQRGTLYLIPNVIAEQGLSTLSPQMLAVLPSIQYFLAEDIRTARRFLSSLKLYPSIEALHFEVLDKKTKRSALALLFEPILQGHHVGVLSESGCPSVADPGALAVQYAHELGIKVVPLVGPSSLLLALMASGLNGQRFAFQGYLPVDSKEAANAIKVFEKESAQKQQTQLFIETPYRNNSLFQNLIKSLHPETRLCVAMNITAEDESIKTLRVKEWQQQKPTFPKVPVVFLFLA